MEQVSKHTICMREHEINKRVTDRLLKIPNLFLLGNNRLAKIPIYSFLIKSTFGKFLHPYYVAALLNDLFGIQSRAGCACAATYTWKLLGIDLVLSRRYREAFFDGQEVLKLGFTRVNFAYFLTDEDIDYVLDAIEFVCEFGWMFLPNYNFDVDRGIWASRLEPE